MTLATRRLGRTGHLSSLAILGGAMFWNTDEPTTERAFEQALAAGVNHIDIAPSYGHAEVVAGPLVAAHRRQLFVGEKSNRRNPDGVRAQLDTTLQRLGTDHVDLYQAHGVTSIADLDTRAGAFEAILRARDEGLTRFVGITGHDLGTAAAQLEAVRRYDLDSVMLPVYPRALADDAYAADLAALVDECARRDVAIMAIKAGAWRPWGDREKTSSPWYEPFTDAARLRRAVRFTLSTPGVVAFCTPGDATILPTVLDAAAAFEPMDAGERDALLADAAGWPIIFPLEANAR
ncbi:MAG: aldo/keto reductase [Acidimicrobiales bacterium]|nr:aldo/keto reductase [Acidimicrobiales bacterium]MCB9394320.1 aldo/keto reductase [Acidimicrobiaceae bacterium]